MTISIRLFPSVLLSLLTLAAPVWAEGLADCRAVSNQSERLACYDRLADVKENVPVSAPQSRPVITELPRTEVVSVAKSAPETPVSRLGKAWELDQEERGKILRIRPYKPVYILPYFHSSNPNQQPSSPAAGHTVSSPIGVNATEAKLQISLKTKIAEDVFGSKGDLWFGYTQSSRWQIYNVGLSRPFRETNYEPELMYVLRTDYDLLGWHGRLTNLSINHQSNGQSLPLSRSWNRVMLSTSLERGDWTMSLRPWWRVKESKSSDDNPDISNYMGRADWLLVRTSGKHQFSTLLRHSLRPGQNSHGAVQLDYAFPIAGDLRGHLQWFSGYGESMIDYNHRSNYFGVGVSLLEWY